MFIDLTHGRKWAFLLFSAVLSSCVACGQNHQQIGRLADWHGVITRSLLPIRTTLLLCYSVTLLQCTPYGERDPPAAPWLPAGNKRTLCPDLVAFLCDCRCLQSRLHRVTADVYHNTVQTFPYGLVLGLGRLFPCHTYSANRDITGQGQADRQADGLARAIILQGVPNLMYAVGSLRHTPTRVLLCTYVLRTA